MVRNEIFFKIFSTIFLVLFLFSGCASIEIAESLHRQGEKEDALDMAISLLDDDDKKGIC